MNCIFFYYVIDLNFMKNLVYYYYFALTALGLLKVISFRDKFTFAHLLYFYDKGLENMK